MAVRAPSRDHITAIEDSRRWAHVALRDDDIVISTPPKCGTTWMQGIVSSLLWPDGDAPGALFDRSPWVDMRLWPVESIAEGLADQRHRRFIKTHSPADTIPISDSVRYVTVYRSAPDALVSWGNHRSTMRAEFVSALNDLAAADGVDPIPESFDGDYEVLLQEWVAAWSPAVHLPSWWTLRNEPNVLLVHYTDLFADMPGEMRRVADFLGVHVAEESWDAVLDRCQIGSMREEARTGGHHELGFQGGADSFFHKGGSGRGRQLLTPEQVERCEQHCADLLTRAQLHWLESGSIAGGLRPEEISED